MCISICIYIYIYLYNTYIHTHFFHRIVVITMVRIVVISNNRTIITIIIVIMIIVIIIIVAITIMITTVMITMICLGQLSRNHNMAFFEFRFHPSCCFQELRGAWNSGRGPRGRHQETMENLWKTYGNLGKTCGKPWLLVAKNGIS